MPNKIIKIKTAIMLANSLDKRLVNILKVIIEIREYILYMMVKKYFIKHIK